MPEIHIINGKPRECSDAVRARGLIDEWLADPDATDKKVAAILADEAAERAANPPEPKHHTTGDPNVNAFAVDPETSSGDTPPRRRRR